MQHSSSSLPALLALGCLRMAAAGGGFLAEHASVDSCVASGSPCQEGTDCCGVCAYIGADTWQCLECTPLDEECIPMGNRCCDGGNKRKDTPLSKAKHVCKATKELSKTYGTTKYTCQATDLDDVANAIAMEPKAVFNSSLEQKTSGEVGETKQCILDGEACGLGVDCCGVCVFEGRSSECRTCVPPGGRCADPFANPCCGGATKRADQGIVNPAYTCQATGKQIGEFGIDEYTCQPAKP